MWERGRGRDGLIRLLASRYVGFVLRCYLLPNIRVAESCVLRYGEPALIHLEGTVRHLQEGSSSGLERNSTAIRMTWRRLELF